MSESFEDKSTKTKRAPNKANHHTCNGCGKTDGQMKLYCDGCDQIFHLFCVCPQIEENAIPDGDWFCRVCAYRLGVTPFSISENDPFYQVHKTLTDYQPQTFEVPKYISKSTDFDPIKKINKYPKEICECCEQKGVHVKCNAPNCPRAFHLQCNDPPLFAVPKEYYCDLHCEKKEKVDENLNPTSIIYMNGIHDDQSFLSPLNGILKLEEKVKKENN